MGQPLLIRSAFNWLKLYHIMSCNFGRSKTGVQCDTALDTINKGQADPVVGPEMSPLQAKVARVLHLLHQSSEQVQGFWRPEKPQLPNKPLSHLVLPPVTHQGTN